MKLTDTQLIILTEAAKRGDRMVVFPDRLKGGAASKVVAPLLKGKLIEEIGAPTKGLAWRRDEAGAKAVRVTRSGLKAISAEEEAEGHLSEPVAAGDPHAASPPAPALRNEGKPGKRGRTASVPGAADPPASRKRRKVGGTSKAPKGRKTGDESRKPNKQDIVLGRLRSTSGASLDALVAATGWQAHSVRGFLSGVVRKKLNLDLRSEGSGRDRVYRVIGTSSTKRTRKASGK